MGRPVTPHNWISEQSRAGVPDEGLGIAGIGFQHFKAPVAGDIGDLEEIRATLDSAGDEAGAQAMAGKGNGIEAKLPGGDLDDCGDVAGPETRC